MSDFVAGVDNAGVITATKKTANILKREFKFREEEVGGDVAGGDKIFGTGRTAEITGFDVKKFSTNGNKVAGGSLSDVGRR